MREEYKIVPDQSTPPSGDDGDDEIDLIELIDDHIKESGYHTVPGTVSDSSIHWSDLGPTTGPIEIHSDN